MKDHIISIATTFLTGLLVVIVPAIDTLTLEDAQTGVLVGLLFAAVRHGLKLALAQLLQILAKDA